MRKILLYLYILLMTALLFTGCGGSNKEVLLKYDLPNAISSIDPQFATGIGQRTIIYNVFDGLMRYGDDGSLVLGAAKEYSVSNDALTYRFTLKDGLKWSDESPITSKDYAFGLKRLFNPQSASPYSDEFLSIKNASAVIANEANLTALGIRTPDDATLIIELEKPNPNFLSLMAHTATMPCNEQFFIEQKGRYATSIDTTLFNGNLHPSKWTGSYMNLRSNPNHPTPVTIPGVNVYFGRGDVAELFAEKDTDLLMLGFHQIDKTADYSYQEYFNTSWSLVCNTTSDGLNDPIIRQAIYSALDTKELKELIEQPLIPSTSLIPPDTMLLGKSYGKLATPPTMPNHIANPMETLYARLKELDLSKMPRINIVVPDLAPCPDIGSLMQRQLRDKLSVYANLEIVPYSEISSKYQAGAYQIILYPASPATITPEAYLRTLASNNSTAALAIEQLISQSQLSSSATQAASYIQSAEQLVVDSFTALPIFLSPSRLVLQEGVSGVIYHPSNSLIDFSKAIKQP